MNIAKLKSGIKEIDDLFLRENDGRVYKCILELLEKELFEKVLPLMHGNQQKAAKLLGINRNTSAIN